MTTGSSTEARVTGATNPNGEGRRVLSGARVTGVVTTASLTVNLAYVRKVNLECISISPVCGPSFMITNITAGDEDVIIGNATLAAAGAAVLAQTGVLGSNFVPYSTCADIINGYCLDPQVPLRIVAINISVATATFDVVVSATVRPGPACS